MEEQWQEREIELFVNFWKQNGRFIAVSVIAVLLGFSGWRLWRYEQRARQEKAGIAYSRLGRDLAHARWARATAESRLIMHRYRGTIEATFAALTRAKLEARDEKWPLVAHDLAWALAHDPDPALAPLIRIRLARVDLEEHDPKAVLALFHGKNPGAYVGLTAWLKGRADRALHHFRRARNDWTLALDNLGAGEGTLRRIVRVEMSTLPASPAKTAPVKTAPVKATPPGAVSTQPGPRPAGAQS